MILLGNTYPLGLVRRPARIEPAPLDELRRRALGEGFLSFWGHDNTRAAATALLGFDPAPIRPRPALALSEDKRPVLEGRVFDEVWVLSPDYVSGFRPQAGEEVAPERIAAWQVLRIGFEALDPKT